MELDAPGMGALLLAAFLTLTAQSAEPDPKALADILRQGTWDRPRTPIEAKEKLAAMGRPAVPCLLALLRESDPAVRRWGEATLRAMVQRYASQAGDAASPLEPLAEALGDKRESPSLRALAADLLGRLKDHRALPALARALEEPELRASVPSALGNLGDPRALPMLETAFANKDGQLRRKAVAAIGSIGGPRLSRVLVAALEDESLDVRFAAVEAIGGLPDPAAASLLGKALRGNDDLFNVAADQLLRRLGTRDKPDVVVPLFIAGLDRQTPQTVGMRLRMLRALYAHPTADAIPALARCLEDPDSRIRAEAVTSLGKLRAPETIPTLLATLSDRNQEVRLHAAGPLIEMGRAEGIPVLIEVGLAGFMPARRRDEFANSLAKCTGQSLGTDQAKWQQWWDANKTTWRLAQAAERRVPKELLEQVGDEAPSLCETCHPMQMRNLEKSAHGRAGYSCFDCHGASVQHMAKYSHVLPDYISKGQSDEPVCGRCHGRQWRELAAGLHGKAIQETPPIRGCAKCHRAHAPLRKGTKEPREE